MPLKLPAQAVNTQALGARARCGQARLRPCGPIAKSDHRHRIIADTAIQAVQTRIITANGSIVAAPGLAIHQRPETEKRSREMARTTQAGRS
jgi:hypothetical protein